MKGEGPECSSEVTRACLRSTDPLRQVIVTIAKQMLARIVFYILARLVQFVAFLMYLSAVHQSIPLTEV